MVSMGSLVRAGSARHQEPLVLGGHERSLAANENRRSHAYRRSDLWWGRAAQRSSSLPPSRREPFRALGYEAVVTEDGPHPQSSSEPSPPGRSIVVLAGPATRVPQVADMSESPADSQRSGSRKPSALWQRPATLGPLPPSRPRSSALVIHCAVCQTVFPPGLARCPACKSDDIMIGVETPGGTRVSAARGGTVRLRGWGEPAYKDGAQSSGTTSSWSGRLSGSGTSTWSASSTS
jgi:hypothetical protein